ncbi:hypothetical protein KOR42_37470 [Thalassoglobus neptunius]|uniref:Uncharacterized protein n=1 Tax=Thalassoglobus neptunius TaxID=1938619 RepID=A0A5C5WIH1_9PLAN|nr:hypothetical protein [Thalassoglobus neptunius]TWT49929.1 hypothetical protein KOR42_37470 [Thalassoglobus neptunius]
MNSSNTNSSKRQFSPTASAVTILLCLVGAIVVLNWRDVGQLSAEPPATVADPYRSPTAKQSVPPQPVFAADQLAQSTPAVAASGSSNPNPQPNSFSTQGNSASGIHREISELDESMWETEQAILREKITQLRQRLAEIENKFHERERRFQTSRRNRPPAVPSPIGLPLGPPDLTNQPPRFDSAPSPSRQNFGDDSFQPVQPAPQQQPLPEFRPQQQQAAPPVDSFGSQQELRDPSFAPTQQQQQSPFTQPEDPTRTRQNEPFLSQEVEHEEVIENQTDNQQRTEYADEKSQQLAIEILGLEVQRAKLRLNTAQQSLAESQEQFDSHRDFVAMRSAPPSEEFEIIRRELLHELRESEQAAIDAEIELKRALLKQQQAMAQLDRNQEEVEAIITFTSPEVSIQSTAIDRELLVLEVEQAKFELETAQSELERVKRLYTSGAANQQDLAEATSRKHSAEISLRRAELLLKRSDPQQGSPPVDALDQPSENQVPTQEPINDAAPEPAESPSLDIRLPEEPAPEDTVPDQSQDSTSDTIQQTELNSVPSDDPLPVELSLSP